MKVLTLEYHDVLPRDGSPTGFPGPDAASYKLSEVVFEDHLRLLTCFRDRCRRVDSAPPSATPPLLLTFDDGGASAATIIGPTLAAHGLTGHFFIPTAYLGTPGFCDANALRTLVAQGHVVGAHSHSHPVRMAHLSDHELDQEWTRSGDLLASILGQRPLVGSVPGGYYSARVARSAARCGFRFLFTSEPVERLGTVDGCTVLGRFTLRAQSSTVELAGLLGPSPWTRYRHWTVWNAKKLLKRTGGSMYLKLRSTWFRMGASDGSS